jgi:hypothetical protein
MKVLLKVSLIALFIVVAAMLLVGPQPADAQQGADRMTVEKNTDRWGGDYHNFFMAKPQPNDCRKACLADAKCLAYTYVKPGIQGAQARCWLKNTVPPPTPADCCESGMKK